MAEYRYTVESSVEPERLLAAATDFSERRLELSSAESAALPRRTFGGW